MFRSHLSDISGALAAAVALTLLLAACDSSSGDTPETTTPTTDGPHALPTDDGKADNYISTNAREYLLSGTGSVALPEGFADLDDDVKPDRLDQVVQRRLAVVARSVKSHIDKVLRDANNGVTGEDAKFFIYVKRNNAKAEAARVVDDKTGAFDFELELIGSMYLMSKVAPGTGRRTFEVEVKDWNDPEAEKLTVQIEGTESRDAFPRYDALFADGVFDIGIHFGGDYNEGRHDLDTARWTVDVLLDDGWENPSVTSFEELKIDSPAFTRKLQVNGQTIEMRVHLYHSDMVTEENEEQLAVVMKESLAKRDVVFYSGHAGPGAGFVLDYQPRYEMRASTFATLDLAEKYQIYVFDGCQTYRTYVDDLMKNPAKTFENVDVITTVNTTPFSVGYQMIWEFLYWLTLTDDAGNHFPLSWKTILRGVNTDQFSSVHYGVHGVDGDPRLNPHGSENIMCRPCTADAECGASGNYCLGYSTGPGCGVACTNDTACGQGYRCGRITDDPKLFYLPKQCIRRDYTCP